MDCFVSQRARLVGVPLDNDGMRLDVLEATLDALEAEGSRPKLLYLQALFHNPRGQCYTRARMEGLIDLCARRSVLILNDEAYYASSQPSTFDCRYLSDANLLRQPLRSSVPVAAGLCCLT